MRKLLFVSSATLSGILIGLLLTVFIVKAVVENSSIQNGAWTHNPMVGNEEASGYSRTAISIIGFLGMTRDESIYFLARTDENQDLLSGSCTYRVEGKFESDDGRWWSITIYNALTIKLIENEENHYSFNGDNISLNEDGSFMFRISSVPQTGNWIPVKESSTFDLVLRMYNPSPDVQNNISEYQLPTIVKESCL